MRGVISRWFRWPRAVAVEQSKGGSVNALPDSSQMPVGLAGSTPEACLAYILSYTPPDSPTENALSIAEHLRAAASLSEGYRASQRTLASAGLKIWMANDGALYLAIANAVHPGMAKLLSATEWSSRFPRRLLRQLPDARALKTDEAAISIDGIPTRVTLVPLALVLERFCAPPPAPPRRARKSFVNGMRPTS